MKNIFAFLLLVALLLLGRSGRAQSVGIGTPTPSPKAVLDLTSTTQGLLIPRLTAAQRTAIAAPPQGLMVYQTDGTAGGGAGTGFWYFAGSGGWVLVNPTGADNLGNHTATQNLNLADKLLVGGTAGAPGSSGLKVAANGNVGVGLGAAAPAYNLDVSNGLVNARSFYVDGEVGLTRGSAGINNIFVGTGGIPGISTTGADNTAVGDGAAGNLFGGNRNTAVGVAAGYNFKDAQHNTALGYYAGYGVSSTNAVPGDSDDNTFIGYQAAQFADGAAGTTALGANAGLNQRGGDHNTFVGNGADLSTIAGQRTNATAIGYQAKVNQDNALVLGGTGLNAVSVGIGTETPFERLHVATGNVKIGANAWATAADDRRLKFGDGNFATVGETGGDDLLQFRGKDFRFDRSGTDPSYTGFVGIGPATVAPLSRLSISPTVVEPKITLWDGGSTTAHYGFGVSGGQLNYHVGTTSDNHVFYAAGKNGDGTELARLTGTGRLGIGSPAPNATLDVRRGTAGDGTAAFWGTTRTSHFSYSTAEDTYLRGGKATSSVFLNDNGGNVGVGTTAVPERLSVAGTVRADINNGSNAAVIGANANTGGFATGVRGTAAGNGYGVLGTAGANGYGVSGSANGSAGRGVDGFSLDGTGVHGETESGTAVRASATTGTALWATATGTGPAAIITQSGTGLALDVTNGAIRTKEVNTPAAGAANMLPLAYGNVNTLGTVQAGSSANVSCSHPSTGVYYITIAGETLTNTGYVTLVQLTGTSTGDPLYFQATGAGTLLVQINGGGSGALSNASFNFVMFKP